MDKLQKQETQPEIKSLLRILKSVSVDTKQDYQWQLFENELFACLDEEKPLQQPPKEQKLFQHRFFPVSWSKRIVSGAAICMITALCVGVLYFYDSSNSVPQTAIHSRVLGIEGVVMLSSDTVISTVSSRSIAQPSSLQSFAENQTIELGPGSKLIIQLEKGIHLVLSENTRLTIEKLTARRIELFLHQGHILASVDTRKKNQYFGVITSQASCSVLGTIFSVTVSSDSTNAHKTDLTVWEGSVAFFTKNNPKSTKIISSGETVSFHGNTLSSPRMIQEDELSIHDVSLLQSIKEIGKDQESIEGVVAITSIPSGAKVFIKDNLVGKTPIVIKRTSGNYIIKFHYPGFELRQDTIMVKKQQSSFVSVTLEKQQQNLSRTTVEKAQQAHIHTNEINEISSSPPPQPLQDTIAPQVPEPGMHPRYVEALIQMSVGEYQKALRILDSLKDNPEISITDRIRIISKISACYKGLGDFDPVLHHLRAKYNETTQKDEKGNILWEIINVKANCLEDYQGAERDIEIYLSIYKNGAWIEQAYAKLAEIQYITGKLGKAIGTFQYHINFFNTSDAVENSIYTLANIFRLDVKDFTTAAQWYSKLLEEYPSSIYYSDALYERAECYLKLDIHEKAREDLKKYIDLYPHGRLKELCEIHLFQDTTTSSSNRYSTD